MNNKSIEEPKYNESTLDTLIADLQKYKTDVEMQLELDAIKNSAEFIQQQEISRFFDDIIPLKDQLDNEYNTVESWTFMSYEFMLTRLVLMPILVKQMYATKVESTWLIDIDAYQEGIKQLTMNNAAWITNLYTTSVWQLDRQSKILTELLGHSWTLMSWWRDARLIHLVKSIKNASIDYAKQYNTLVNESQSESEKNQEDRPKKWWFFWKLFRLIKDWNFDFDTAAEERDNSSPKEKRNAMWLWLWLLCSWAYMIFKKSTKRTWFTENALWIWKDILTAWSLWTAWWVISMAIMRMFEKKQLTFEEALAYVDNQVMHNISEKSIKKWFDWVKYDEWDWSIVSYNNKRTLINYNAKKIQWFDSVTFKSYESLIHAANFINYIQENLAYTSRDNEPFSVNQFNWNIVMVNAQWNSKKILSWWRFSTLSSICPEINDTRKSRALFCTYLNQLWCWKQKWPDNNFEDDKTIYWQAMRDMIKKISERNEWKQERWQRKLDYEHIEASQTKDVIAIKSYDKMKQITVMKSPSWVYERILFNWYWEDYFLSASRKHLWHRHKNNEDLLLEWCLHANLFNRLAKHNHNLGQTSSPYTVITDWFGFTLWFNSINKKFGNEKQLYNNPKNKAFYPTLFKHISKPEAFRDPKNTALIKLLNKMYQDNQANPHFSNNNNVNYA